MREDLLDYLAERAHCAYLSDLHLPEVYTQLWPLLNGIPNERYTLNQWTQAISYILGKDFHFSKISAAKDYFYQQTAG